VVGIVTAVPVWAELLYQTKLAPLGVELVTKLDGFTVVAGQVLLIVLPLNATAVVPALQVAEQVFIVTVTAFEAGL
jgi:hypothetical protein